MKDEPLTEEELARMERMAAALDGGAVPGGVAGVDVYRSELSADVLRLIAEVRRLRAAIEKLDAGWLLDK